MRMCVLVGEGKNIYNNPEKIFLDFFLNYLYLNEPLWPKEECNHNQNTVQCGIC